MSTKNKTKSEVTSQTAASEPAEQPEQAVPEAPTEAQPEAATPTATQLATTATAALATIEEDVPDDGVTALHLVKILPHKAKRLRRLHIPSEAEFEEARAKLSPKAQTRFDDLIERLSPDKLGNETDTKRFRPQTIKLRQGTTKDENCPEMCDAGGLYTSDGIVLTAPSEAKAKKGGVSTNVLVVVLAHWKGRALFAPRVNSKVVPLQEFGDANADYPYCRSLDRIVGAPVKNVQGVGQCGECPYKPWKVQGEPNLCNDNVSVLFVLVTQEPDGTIVPFDGLYEMTFSKSATPTGNHICELADKGNVPWERVLKLSAKEETGKTEGVYYTPQAAVLTDDNGRPVKVAKTDAEMLTMLYNQLMVSYYYPNLADVYRREEKTRTGGTNASASKPKSDMSELERRAAAMAGEAPKATGDMRDANV